MAAMMPRVCYCRISKRRTAARTGKEKGASIAGSALMSRFAQAAKLGGCYAE
jgi:hypothetical protein